MIDSDLDGLEVGRFMGDARMGVGPMWNDNLVPKRSLDVIRRNDDKPQFRITYTAGSSETSGRYADFQVSKNSNLHLKPTSDGANNRTVAIGFLDGELAPVVNHATLDVGGITRVRKLPDTWDPKVLIMGYELADVNADDDDDYMLGRIDMPGDSCLVLNSMGEWIDICNGIGGADCRWEDVGSGTITGELDMRMGFDPTADCYRGKVAIGVQFVKEAKLELHAYQDRDAVLNGGLFSIRSGQNNDEKIFTGVQGIANGIQGANNTAKTYIGVSGSAGAEFFGKYNVGVRALGYGTEDGLAIGLYAKAEHQYGAEIGVYTEGHTALYVLGGTTTTGSTITLSDESVKTNVNDIEDATSLLNQMQPKSYLMQNPENRELNFDEGTQYGFLSQEMEAVFPDIVRDIVIPEKMDSTGFIEGTSIPLKGIKYQSLIPILVAGFNEQNSTITDQATQIALQNETIENLEAQLEAQATQLEQMQNDMQSVLAAVQTMQQKTANCCTLKAGTGETGAIINENHKELELQQNIPNPFNDQTKIAFNLPKTADVILEITDAAGRPLERLIDGKMSSGEHTTLWDGSKVASGIYFYTLYADGELITKKMIKH